MVFKNASINVLEFFWNKFHLNLCLNVKPFYLFITAILCHIIRYDNDTLKKRDFKNIMQTTNKCNTKSPQCKLIILHQSMLAYLSPAMSCHTISR